MQETRHTNNCITFPKLHTTYLYLQDYCAKCTQPLGDTNKGSEIIDVTAGIVAYLCTRCSDNTTEQQLEELIYMKNA